MKDHLKSIEKRLQDFFENQLQNLAGKDVYSGITEVIVNSIHEKTNLRDGKKYAPNIYRISSSSRHTLNEEELAAYTDALKSIIRNICQEEGLNLSGPIHVQYFHDPNLEKKFQVEVNFSIPASRDTTRIMAEDDGKESLCENIPGFLITSSDEVFEIQNKITNIGRKEDNELVVDNLLVSRLHAQIRTLNGKHVLFDIDSTAGTKVNGQRIRQQPLNPGDVIEIADVSLIYYRELDDSQMADSAHITKKIS